METIGRKKEQVTLEVLKLRKSEIIDYIIENSGKSNLKAVMSEMINKLPEAGTNIYYFMDEVIESLGLEKVEMINNEYNPSAAFALEEMTLKSQRERAYKTGAPSL